MKSLINFLKKRKLINKITKENELINIIKERSINLYCGFDLTSNSLHLGHLIPLICLKHFNNYGHKIILLLGSATSLVGDPSFKNEEREVNKHINIKKWKVNIKKQIKKILKFKKINIIDNYNWYKKINVINFLNKIGKYFPVNKIINKDSIKNRIKNKYISFSEFSYILLQSYDYFILNKKYNVVLQIGGSDQWVNITSGIYLNKKINKKKTFGLTFPLVLKKNGLKFGKTEKNNIWLDKKKTSYYKFYQYWINISDIDVYNLLKKFTSISISKIDSIKRSGKNAQYILASKMTKLVHGKKGLKIARKITYILFNCNFKKTNKKEVIRLMKYGLPYKKLKIQKDFQSLLVNSKLASSKNKAKNIILNNAISINGIKENNINYNISKINKIFNKFTLIKRGKKKHCLIYWK